MVDLATLYIYSIRSKSTVEEFFVCGVRAGDLPGNFEKALPGSCKYICNGSVSTYTLPVFRGLPR